MANKAVKKNLSAEKRVRQAKKQRERNQSTVSEIRTYTRKFNEALEGKDREKIEAAYLKAIKALNKASSSGVLKKNNASRRISTLSRKLHLFTSGQAA
jgi:small subunit ribosomal protein S20